ncbi:MAG: phosphoribosylamine--glycine ligase [Bauldia sp.]|nr:phosphoribosylamine--glycine ligase [Bauldia sp.]
MHVLLIGSGGREHALAWKLRRSPLVERLYAAPGNPGIAAEAELVTLDPDDHAAVTAFCRDNAVGLVVVGPEQPLVAGIADALAAAGIPVFGPSAAAARLEGSKGFTKDLCAEAGIPTAAYGRFTNAAAAKAYVATAGAPIVVKADGLAAGKGVVVATSVEEANAAIDACFAGDFGAAGAEVVVEEYLEGIEASLFALSDGETAIPFGTAQDYKRAFDGDTGPNTGGMGAISPAPALPDRLVEEAMRTIVLPTVRAMKARGTPFRGVLYAGLMVGTKGPQLIEYNVRFGDPECQALMRRLRSDLAPILMAVANGRLGEVMADWTSDPAVAVVMASKGYPGPFEKGTPIRRLPKPADDVMIFHAGTALRDGALVASGGRVLNVTALAESPAAARADAYDALRAIDWPGGFYRSDIGRMR